MNFLQEIMAAGDLKWGYHSINHTSDDMNENSCYCMYSPHRFSCLPMLHTLRLPADPEERRVAMARRGLRGLPGQTRTTSSWHCKQMTWFSGFSPTLLQPMFSSPAWIFIPLLIWRTSRMSAPASYSSILVTGGGHTSHYAWLQASEGGQLLPSRNQSILKLQPPHWDRVCSNLTSALSCQPLWARVAGGVAVFTHGCRRGCFTWLLRSQCQDPVGVLVGPKNKAFIKYGLNSVPQRLCQSQELLLLCID